MSVCLCVVYVSGVSSKTEQSGGVERAIVSGGPQLEQRLPVLDIRKHSHVVFADGQRWVVWHAKLTAHRADYRRQLLDLKAGLEATKADSGVARKNLVCVFQNAKVTELNGAAASGGVALLVNRAHMSQADASPSLLLGEAIEVEHTLAEAAKALSVFINIL